MRATPVRPSLVERAMEEAGDVADRPGPFSRRKDDKPGAARRRPAADIKPFRLDFASLSKKGFLTPGRLNTDLGKQIAAIKRSIVRRLEIYHRQGAIKSRAPRRNSLLVTSPTENAGKSFLTLNLAIDLVFDGGMDVLLIDADLKKASLSEDLGLRNDAGLLDVLAGKLDNFQACLRREADSSLLVLPVGSKAEPNNIGGHETINNLVKIIDSATRVYSDYIVIIDSPPILATVDAAALSECADETIIVVDSEKTTTDHITSAVENLRNVDNVSLLLNKTRMPVRASSYYGA